MNILIAAWEKCSLEKVRETFEMLGHPAFLYQETPRDLKQDPRFRSMLRRYVKEEKIDAVFSIKYYPILSRVCQETDIAYICWCPTLSMEDLLGLTLRYEKNYYFLFDRHAIGNLQQAGLANVFYLPYALDFPEQIEMYNDTNSPVAFSYVDGYMWGLLQIREYMRKYEERMQSDFEAHSLKKRLTEVLLYFSQEFCN